jgi:hypothetical protein
MELKCPACGSKDLRCAREEGILASLFRRFELRPYRCRSCRTRFFRAWSYGHAAHNNVAPHRLRRFGFVSRPANATQ